MRRRRRRVAIGALIVVLLAALVLLVPRVILSTAAVDAAPAGPGVVVGGVYERAPVAQELPVPQLAVVAAAALCDEPAVQAALAARDDEAVVEAAGGGESFRAAVIAGAAPCISLSDPARRWVVVDKLRPLSPLDYEPANLGSLSQVTSLNGGHLRQDADAALSALGAGAAAAGVGDVAVLSSYRSYRTQVSTYAQHVDDEGQAVADAGSARPGYSEHQTGLALDMVACGRGCGGLDDFGATAQGQWVAQHAWEYGFIVRYEDGYMGVTGYESEPWHLRFIGPALAKAYHDGGFHTLEDFFGLPPAPDYAG